MMSLPVILSKVRAIIAVGVLASVSAAGAYFASINWADFGPFGVPIGLFLGAVVAYLKRDKFLVSLLARVEMYSRELETMAADRVKADA